MQRKSLIRKNNPWGYVFILPMAIIFLVFFGYSIFFLVWSSFHRITISFKEPQWVGIKNYLIVLRDPLFFSSVINSFLLSFSSILVALTLGFVISVFVSFSIPGRKIFLALFFIPAMLPLAFISIVFANMLEYTDGIVNAIARISGMHILDQYWLSDPNLAMFSVMAVSIYIVGIPIMYYTSDISTLNNSIFEAARIDGANLFQIIILILHPLLNRTHKAIALSLLLVGFREMERVFLMTNGGPGGSTEIIGTYIYHNIRQPGGNLGFVSSVGVLVLLFALAIAIVQIFNGRQPTGSAE